MKVKIGNQIHDGDNEPVMVILSAADRENILAMAPGATRYAQGPKSRDAAVLRAWTHPQNDNAASLRQPLPTWLLDLIGAYGSARSDPANQVEAVYRWEQLLDGIHRHAGIEVRNTVLDEAARAAERCGRPVGAADYDTYIPGSSADAARAIRALKRTTS